MLAEPLALVLLATVVLLAVLVLLAALRSRQRARQDYRQISTTPTTRS